MAPGHERWRFKVSTNRVVSRSVLGTPHAAVSEGSKQFNGDVASTRSRDSAPAFDRQVVKIHFVSADGWKGS